jgi:hypothetical protein
MYVCAFKSLSIPLIRSWVSFGIWHKLPPPGMDHSGISSRKDHLESVFWKASANVWHLAEPTSSCATSTCIRSDPGRENG